MLFRSFYGITVSDMSLTITYTLGFNGSHANARKAIQELQQCVAITKPWSEPTDVIDAHCGDLPAWLALPTLDVRHGSLRYPTLPSHAFAFAMTPGVGQTPVTFGLAKYPERIEVEADGTRTRIDTGATGWSWRASCTLRDTDPTPGGIYEFLLPYFTVRLTLGSANVIGILRNVDDPTGYWDRPTGNWDNHNFEKLVDAANALRDCSAVA
jgi:hypothetical protein